MQRPGDRQRNGAITPQPANEGFFGDIPKGSRLNIINSDRAIRLQVPEAISVYMDRWRGQPGQDNTFVFRRIQDGDCTKEELDIEPTNYARTPEELIEKQQKAGLIVGGGFLSATRMRFTIEEASCDSLLSCIARAFGATHRAGTRLEQFARSEVYLFGVRRGSISTIVTGLGLAFPEF